MSFETSALILTWVALLTLAFGMAGLLRQIRAITAVLQPNPVNIGPAVGSLAPDLDVLPVAYNRRAPHVLIFVDTDCGSCDVVLEHLALARKNTPLPNCVALFRGQTTHVDGTRNGLHILAEQAHMFAALQVPVTPFAVAVGGDGRVRAADAVGSPDALDRFLDQLK